MKLILFGRNNNCLLDTFFAAQSTNRTSVRRNGSLIAVHQLGSKKNNLVHLRLIQ